MENHYKTKSIINVLMASMTLLLLVIFVFDIELTCVFNALLNVRCPACGLTHAFKSLLNLDLIGAINNNIISIPLFISVILFYILYFVDLIFKKNILVRIYDGFSKHYILIIIVIIILTIYNNF